MKNIVLYVSFLGLVFSCNSVKSLDDYKDVRKLNSNLFAVWNDGLVALADSVKLITPFIYSGYHSPSDNIIALNKDGYYGFYNFKTGRKTTKFIYEKIGSESEGVSVVWKKTGSIDFIENDSGEILFEEIYSDAKGFKEGLCPVKFDERWGYIDRLGNLKIETMFDYADVFNDGFARVRINKIWMCINNQGEIVYNSNSEYITEEVNKTSCFKDKRKKLKIKIGD